MSSVPRSPVDPYDILPTAVAARLVDAMARILLASARVDVERASRLAALAVSDDAGAEPEGERQPAAPLTPAQTARARARHARRIAAEQPEAER